MPLLPLTLHVLRIGAAVAVIVLCIVYPFLPGSYDGVAVTLSLLAQVFGGTREFVVYNPRDEHTMISHEAWILLSLPEQLGSRQGWYAAKDGPGPHWRCFLFD